MQNFNILINAFPKKLSACSAPTIVYFAVCSLKCIVMVHYVRTMCKFSYSDHSNQLNTKRLVKIDPLWVQCVWLFIWYFTRKMHIYIYIFIYHCFVRFQVEKLVQQRSGQWRHIFGRRPRMLEVPRAHRCVMSIPGLWRHAPRTLVEKRHPDPHTGWRP